MQGKVSAHFRHFPARGITPAYAGKRTLVGECPKPLWDHPRVCGEKNNTAKTYSNMEGSPPRMRGKGQAGRKVVVELGITPAYAGKSTPDRLFLYHLGDHPRVCGEKPGGRLRELVYPGSPPRVRGKAKRHARLLLPAGITPACAGKRGWLRPAGQRWRDHPRVCGEKALSTFSSRKNSGSPPRMRGKDADPHTKLRRYGITPAYAGKSI